MSDVFVAGAFDDIRSRDIRFLEEAARLGPVTVGLWDDERTLRETGKLKFPYEERKYVLEACAQCVELCSLCRIGSGRPGEAAALHLPSPADPSVP